MKNYTDILREQFRLYPMMELQDLYKLIYQSAMGPVHAVNDSDKVFNWMRYEVKNLQIYNDENMIEEITIEPCLLRINLRPFINNGGDTDKLSEIFIETANTFKGDISNIPKFMNDFLDLYNEINILINKDTVIKYFNSMKERSFPPIHHSKIYHEKYKPAYRVVLKELFDRI